ncbi:MAG: hypothetical protein ACW98X_24830 [Promethearchaeota archaeon]|jgi:hypothetical protein
MNDSNKEAEYRRTIGVKETYVHETAYYDGLCKKAKHRKQTSKKRIVLRQGHIPPGKGATVTISQAQWEAYTIITEVLASSKKDSIQIAHLRDVGIREATLKALSKSKLIEITEEAVRLWKRTKTDQEIMEKGGVGTIVISMGVK